MGETGLVKLLFLVVTLFIQNPMTMEVTVSHEVSQVKGETCEEAKADEDRNLEATYMLRHIVQAAYDCKIIEVDPSMNQNGTV